MDIKDWRIDYDKYSIDEATLPTDPFLLFDSWFTQAQSDGNLEPNAMVLSTVRDQMPNARVVLLKAIEDRQFVFYSNYESNKGIEISDNNNVSLVFFWQKSQRQVRVQGRAIKLSRENAVDYFNSRPLQSRISAIASPQSRQIAKSELISNTENVIKSNKYECPEHWGGYGVVPSSIEFWQGQLGRLHDRILYTKSLEWNQSRLAP